MSDPCCSNRAEVAAYRLRKALGISGDVRIGLILGTGWGDVLKLRNVKEVPFKSIPGFEGLREIEGHARRVAYGTIGGVPVIALRGRVHLNEAPCSPRLMEMVRLQVEMLIRLGVNRLILTCAVGHVNFPPGVGDVCVIDGFVTLFAPDMPLYAGEFCSPEDTLDRDLIKIALDSGEPVNYDGKPGSGRRPRVAKGGHAMVRGPFFEGRRYDKSTLAQAGASVVGMSVLPEACVAALYPGVRVLGLGYETNGASEEHSHETNLARAKSAAVLLGGYLRRIIKQLTPPPARTRARRSLKRTVKKPAKKRTARRPFHL